MFENVDGRTDAGVTGIQIAHLEAFGSGELKKSEYHQIARAKHNQMNTLTNAYPIYIYIVVLFLFEKM